MMEVLNTTVEIRDAPDSQRLCLITMIQAHCLMLRFTLALLLVSFNYPGDIFSQDRPARIVIDSVEVPTNGTGFVNRYGVTREDFASLQDQVADIKWSAPIRLTMAEVRYGSRDASGDLLGTTGSYAQMLDVTRIRGRFLLKKDVEHFNNVAVIGAKLAQQLFDDRDPIGQNVHVGPDYYLIVGIVEAEALRNEFQNEPVPIRSETRFHFDKTETTTYQVVPVEDLEKSLIIPISTMQVRNGDDAITRAQGSFSASSFQFSRIELVLENSRRTLETARLIDRILKANHPQNDYRIQLPR
jgi:putative ABC transport system permease protein